MLLTIVVLLPVFGALALLLIPSEQAETIRRVGFAVALVTFLLSVGLICQFQSAGGSRWQFETDVPWINSPEIHFHLGIDGISLWLIMLTTFLVPISLLASWNIGE